MVLPRRFLPPPSGLVDGCRCCSRARMSMSGIDLEREHELLFLARMGLMVSWLAVFDAPPPPLPFPRPPPFRCPSRSLRLTRCAVVRSRHRQSPPSKPWQLCRAHANGADAAGADGSAGTSAPTGPVYYFNTATGESSWSHPDAAHYR